MIETRGGVEASLSPSVNAGAGGRRTAGEEGVIS
jgi:hypothetical protein